MQEIVLLTMQDLDITIGYDEMSINKNPAQIQALIQSLDRCFLVPRTGQITAHLIQHKIKALFPAQNLFCSVITKFTA